MAAFEKETFAFENYRAGDSDLIDQPCTIVSGSNTTGTPIPKFTVMGRITASGKYTPYAAGATDGSQTPVAILAESGVDAGAADKASAMWVAGEFSKDALVAAGGVTDAVIHALRQVGIIVKTIY